MTRDSWEKTESSAIQTRPARAKFDDHSSEQSVITALPVPTAVRIYEGAREGMRALSPRGPQEQNFTTSSYESVAGAVSSTRSKQVVTHFGNGISEKFFGRKSPWNCLRAGYEERGSSTRLARRSTSVYLESSATSASEILAESKRNLWESKFTTKPKSSSAESTDTVAAVTPQIDRGQTREQNNSPGNRRAASRQATSGILRCHPPQCEPAVENLNSQSKGGSDHSGNGNQKLWQGLGVRSNTRSNKICLKPQVFLKIIFTRIMDLNQLCWEKF